MLSRAQEYIEKTMKKMQKKENLTELHNKFISDGM